MNVVQDYDLDNICQSQSYWKWILALFLPFIYTFVALNIFIGENPSMNIHLMISFREIREFLTKFIAFGHESFSKVYCTLILSVVILNKVLLSNLFVKILFFEYTLYKKAYY